MAQEHATTTQKPVDIFTIKGLLEILGDNINSIKADSSDENIKKSNAILQNVNAIKGIYTLAFDRERLENLKGIDDDFASYRKPEQLFGNVFGDETDRLERNHQRQQDACKREYDRVKKELQFEVEANADKQDSDSKAYEFGNFYGSDIDILNTVLERATDKDDISTHYKMAVFCLENVTPQDFGVEE